jgi:DNA-binding NarL/FixJ family response regulator
VAAIRVLVAAPPAVRSVLGELLTGADDITIVRTAVGAVEILLAVGEANVDLVLVLLEGDTVPGIATHLLAEYPLVKILAVTGDTRHAVLYEMHPRLVPLGDLAAGGLAGAIRTAVRTDAAE